MPTNPEKNPIERGSRSSIVVGAGEPPGEPGVPGMTYEIGGGSPDLGP
jgi:hypothetical protein